MAFYRTVTLIFLLGLLYVTADDQPRRKGKREDLPQAAPPPSSNKTRKLHFEYSFKSETVLYDILPNKEASPSTFVEANLTFDILAHAEGETLGKWTLASCISGNCGNPPPLWVNFRRGGNNLLQVYIDPKDVEEGYVPRWNFLYAIVHHIYTPAESGEGDEQYVATPYGHCHVFFSKPEDKHFRRQMKDCDMKGIVNSTRMNGLLPIRYKNDVHYLQNVKVDADIVVIDSIEELAVASPFDEKFGLVIETRSHMEMNNRTVSITDRPCLPDDSIHNCALTTLGFKQVSERLYENVTLGELDEPQVQKKKLENAIIRLRKIHSNDKSWTEEHSAAYSDLIEVLVTLENSSPSSFDILGKMIQHDDNYDIRSVLSSALGSLGGVESLRVAKEVIFSKDSSFSRYDSDFFFGLSHNIHGEDDKWLKELTYWMIELKKDISIKGKRYYWQLANSLATVLRRDCERTPSSVNRCKTGKRAIINKFIAVLTTNCDTTVCKERVLGVLLNLPQQGSFVYSRDHLCTPTTTPSIQLRALQVIARVPHSFYDSQLISTLIRIFRNTCPQLSTTGESMAALDVLIKSVPDQQNAATLILRTEHLVSPSDHELWSYLYNAVSVSRSFDVGKDDFWSRLRSFRVFRPNYSQRSLNADSTSFGEDVIEFAGFRGRLRSSSEFGKGIFKGSHLSLDALKGNGPRLAEHSLFELDIESSGLDGYVDSDFSALEGSNPKALVRLSLLGHSIPPFVVFEGHTDMMNAVMSANGQIIKAFEGSSIVRLHSSVFPLLSGLSVYFSSSASTSIRVLGSAEISLWNRDSRVNIQVNTSSSLTASASLLLDGVQLHSINSRLSLIGSITSTTDAKFAKKPYNFCVNMGRDETVVGQTTTRKENEGHEEPKTQTTSEVRRIPGESWSLGESITKQCQLLLKSK